MVTARKLATSLLIGTVAVAIWLLPGSSIAAGSWGAWSIWRNRRRRQAEAERWNALEEDRLRDEVLPADWRTRTLDDTFPDQLM